MTRPSTVNDLPDFERKGHTVATVYSAMVTKFPSLGQHLLAALAEADRLGLKIVDEDIVIEPTPAELDKKIASAQESWDSGKGLYEKYLETGEFPQYTYLWNAYLRAEGIDQPMKPVEN